MKQLNETSESIKEEGFSGTLIREENSLEEKPEVTTTSYFYFCLDCEERSSGKSEFVKQKCFL